MRTIEINGRQFELTIPKESVKPYLSTHVGTFADIYRAYDSPSDRKVLIWRGWLMWACSTDGIKSFNITSHNCMNFSISGLYVDNDGYMYNLWITKCHNRAIFVGSTEDHTLIEN